MTSQTLEARIAELEAKNAKLKAKYEGLSKEYDELFDALEAAEQANPT